MEDGYLRPLRPGPLALDGELDLGYGIFAGASVVPVAKSVAPVAEVICELALEQANFLLGVGGHGGCLCLRALIRFRFTRVI